MLRQAALAYLGLSHKNFSKFGPTIRPAIAN